MKPLVLEWKSPPSDKPDWQALVARLGRLEIELRDVPCLGWEATARVVFDVRPKRQDAMESVEAALPEVLREALAAWEHARARKDAEAKRAALVATRYTPEQVAALEVGDPVGVYTDAVPLHAGKVRRRYPSGKLLICYEDKTLTVMANGSAIWRKWGYRDSRYIGPPSFPEDP